MNQYLPFGLCLLLVFPLACARETGPISIPEESLDPPWLAQRKNDQLATVEQFQVFHGFKFTDRIKESGITFEHKIVDDAGKSFVASHYDHGTGVAIADVDSDGHYDIYFVNQVGGNELWRNLGDGRFENITDSAGVAIAERISVGASFADTDNDGDPDLFVTTVRGGNLFLENDGTGNFADISEASGLDHVGHSSGAVFFDFNRDGKLDLFVSCVGTYTKDEVGADGAYRGMADAFSGHLKPARAELSKLYLNQGKNRFENVTTRCGLGDELSWTGDASPLDANEDGWTDLYVLNMQGHDEYYENVRGEKFVKKSREQFPRTPWGAMGVKVFDYNNDGRMDVYITDMHSDMSELVEWQDEKLKSNMQWPESMLNSGGNSIYGNAFFENDGEGGYREVSDEIGAENYWPWGLSVGDFNADGFMDAFLASSMNYPYRYGVNSLLLNNEGKRFLDSEFILGVEPRRNERTAKPWFEVDFTENEVGGAMQDKLERLRRSRGDQFVMWSSLGSRTSVIFDLDHDGDLDIVTGEFNAEPMVLVSNLTEVKDIHFIKIKLIGTESNRDGLGATVVVRTSQGEYTQVHDGKSGYLSQSSCLLYFGLGDADAVDEIEVRWPSGKTQLLTEQIVVNSLLEITEQ